MAKLIQLIVANLEMARQQLRKQRIIWIGLCIFVLAYSYDIHMIVLNTTMIPRQAFKFPISDVTLKLNSDVTDDILSKASAATSGKEFKAVKTRSYLRDKMKFNKMEVDISKCHIKTKPE